MAEIIATTRATLEHTVPTLVAETQRRVNEQRVNQQEHQAHLHGLLGPYDFLIHIVWTNEERAAAPLDIDIAEFSL